MTVRFKKVRDFERLSMIHELESAIMKDNGDTLDIYEIDNMERKDDDVLDYGLSEGSFSA